VHRPGEVFERGSHVLDYWLANSEGFTVDKQRVTAVVIDPETRHARSLIVQRSRRRTHVVAADSITAVDPHGRVLYVAPRRRRERMPRRTQTVAVTMSHTARASASRSRAALAVVTPVVATQARRGATGSTSAARVVGRRSSEAVAWLAAGLVSVTATCARRGVAFIARASRAAARHCDAALAWLAPIVRAYAQHSAALAVGLGHRSRAATGAYWRAVKHRVSA
jgi:hypothetical protein